jgi:predicted PurR-regulated permease PerM
LPVGSPAQGFYFGVVEKEKESNPLAMEQRVENTDYVNRAVEASIYIGLAIILVTACLLILRPFVPLLAWGIIIAVAVYPGLGKLQALLGGSQVLAGVLCTLILLAVVLLPVILLTQSLVQSTQVVIASLKAGTLAVPPPPPAVGNWPIIGAPLARAWGLASNDLTDAIRSFAPQIKEILPGLLSTSAGIGLTVVQLLLSILVAGVLLANAQAAYDCTCSVFGRIFGAKGPEFQQLIGATIRSVTFGILGVAIIQSVFAALGFLVVGLPGAGLWTVIFVFAAVLQAGALVLIPAVIYVFAIASTTKAVLFLVWCIIVGVIDNMLKPLLLGRGVAVPVAVVFLGAIGGFVAMGIIGLFVGAIVLSLGYKLFLAWLDRNPAPNQEA